MYKSQHISSFTIGGLQMKQVFSFFLLFLFILTPIFAQDVESEKEAIKNVINESYADGLCNYGDLEAINKGFHPAFTLMGVGGNNQLWKHPIYNWAETSVKNKKEKPTPPEKWVTLKFPFVDVSGNAAVAKVAFYEGERLAYYDYLSLYKFEEGWKIITKIFYALPKDEDEKEK